MTDDPSQPDLTGDESLPPRLVQDLARVDSTRPTIPSSLDAAILSGARSDFVKRMRLRTWYRWGATAASIAAIVAIVVVTRLALVHPARNLARGDIDGNGTVDMVDAYLLAKRVASGSKTEHAWDVNGDGVVDQNDVDWIANAAVSLDHGATGGKAP